MRIFLAAVLALALAPAAAAGPPAPGYEPPDRDPTPEETLILEFMNRFRSDPSAEADRIAPPGTAGGGVDWKRFREEMKALRPMPPLVFNLDLLDAARRHSYYMVQNGLTHIEAPGKEGFYGAGPADRIQRSGYRSGGGAENAFARSGGPWDSHSGFLVDQGDGPGGMQPERGHRRNMIGAFREVGPGAVPNGAGLSVTHDFGSRDVRMAGGVVYVDAQGKGFYDLGLGLGQVQITASDGAQGATWRSGAFALDLKSQKEVVLTATYAGEKFTKAFPAGRDNLKFDWAVPKEIPFKVADRLIEAVDRAKEPAKQFAAEVALVVGARGLYLDPERRTRVGELTREVASNLETAQQAVNDALKDPDGSFRKTVEEQRKPYRGTEADAWFQDAETLGKLKRGWSNFQKSAGGHPSEKEKKDFVSLLEAEGARIRTLQFRSELSSLISRVKGL